MSHTRAARGPFTTGVAAAPTLTTLMMLATSPACTLTPYPSGAITCTVSTDCPDDYACLDLATTKVKTCVRIGCGDGQVDVADDEQCDDANENALDLCDDQCRESVYVVDDKLIVGFGPGAAAADKDIGRPNVVVASADGTVFIGSIGTNLITRLESSSQLTAFAGNGSLVSLETTAPTPPNEVSTVFISSLALDGLGNLYVSLLQPSIIRRIDAITGAATTVAGTEFRDLGGEDVIGNQSPISLPKSLIVDGDGSVFFVETGAFGKRIRRVDRVTGRLTTVLDGALRTSPDGIAFDEAGNLFAFSADHQVSRNESARVAITEHFLIVARVSLTDPDQAVSELEIPTFTERVTFELNADGTRRLVNGNTVVDGRETLEQGACPLPNSSQHRFALSADGRRVFYPAGLRFMQLSLPADGSGDAADCFVLGEAPVAVVEDDLINLSPTDAAVDGDDVLFADPSNRRIWRVAQDTSGQSPESVAGRAAEPAADPVQALFDELVLEFAKETDGHLGVVFTTACNDDPLDTLDLSKFEFFAPLPELHRVMLSDCGTRVTVLAGTGTPGFSGDGGPAAKAQLSRPSAAARRPSTLERDDVEDRSIFIADRDNDRIRRIVFADPLNRDAGTIDTFVGPGASVTGPDGDLALERPSGLTFDDDGGLLIADTNHHRIVRVDVATREYTVLIGTGVAGDNDGNGDSGELTAAETQLNEPSSLVFLPFRFLASEELPVVPPGGLLVIAERGSNRVRAAFLPPITGLPPVITLAGDGVAGDRDDAVDGKKARFFRPRGLMLAPPTGELTALSFFIVDGIDRIRAMSLAVTLDAAGLQILTTVNTRTALIDGVGAASRDDGLRDGALFRSPTSMAVLGDDRLLIADRNTGRLRLVTPSTGRVRTVSGMPDGKAPASEAIAANEAAPLRQPEGLALVPGGAGEGAAAGEGGRPTVVFASEARDGAGGPATLRRFTLTDPDDPATWTTDVVVVADVTLGRPAGLTYDPAPPGTLYIADSGAQAVYGVEVNAIEGGVAHGFVVAGIPFRRGATGDDGDAIAALLNEPEGVAVHPTARVLFVADTGNNRVRRVDLGDLDGLSGLSGSGNRLAQITTVLGDGDAASGGEGAPAGSFPVQRPRGLAIDASGNLLVTSTTAIRFLQAGDDGEADENDDVRTVYGRPPRDRFPEPVTRCLSDVALSQPRPGTAQHVFAIDSCLGVLLRLDRRPRPADDVR